MSKKINKRITTLLYIQIVFCYLIDHLDLGIIAVSAIEIQRDLKLSESELGLLASGLYIGNVFGSVLCPMLFRKFHPKLLMIVACILNALFLLPFTFIENNWGLLVSRILTGVFQVFFVIYFPVWIDQCAPSHLKTIWLTVLFLTVPLGIVVGYGITAIMMSFVSWKWAFLVETVLLIVPVCIFFILIPG